jgi:hypothetical protein
MVTGEVIGSGVAPLKIFVICVSRKNKNITTGEFPEHRENRKTFSKNPDNKNPIKTIRNGF